MGRKDVAFNISIEVAVVEIAIFKILVPSLSRYLSLIFFCQGLNMDERLHLLENRVLNKQINTRFVSESKNSFKLN